MEVTDLQPLGFIYFRVEILGRLEGTLFPFLPSWGPGANQSALIMKKVICTWNFLISPQGEVRLYECAQSLFWMQQK